MLEIGRVQIENKKTYLGIGVVGFNKCSDKFLSGRREVPGVLRDDDDDMLPLSRSGTERWSILVSEPRSASAIMFKSTRA